MKKTLLSLFALLCMTVSGAWAQDGVEWQVGKVIAANGKVYNTVSDANTAGTTASGVIAYITSGGSAMALSLTNASTGTVFCSSQGYSGWIANYTTPSAAFGAAGGVSATNSYVSWQNQGYGTWNAASIARNYSTSRPSIASAWSLPSAGDWNNMLKALAGTNTNLSETSQSVFSYTSVSAKLTAAGASGLGWTNYWTTTEGADGYAWSLHFTDKGGSISPSSKTYGDYMYVRPYFTFSVPQQTVTYNANGGSGAPSAQSKNYNASLTLSSTEPTRDGYTFTGWNTQADGSGTSYAAGATYTANADVTLYAQWTENTAILSEADDNSSWISEKDGEVYDVTLTRTLQTGGWNTFAVPFDAEIPAGWTVKQLTGATMSGKTLTITFDDATTIEAGKPYLVKVDAAVENPTFADVTINKDIPGVSFDAVDFIPTLGTITLPEGRKNILFIGAANTLYHPSAEGQQMKGFRAYFVLKGEALNAQSFALDFGEGEATAIEAVNANDNANLNVPVNICGQRIGSGYKGIVIMNGKKVIK